MSDTRRQFGLLRLVVLALASASLTACDDPTAPAGRTHPDHPAQSSHIAAARFGLPIGIDEEFVNVALRVPGYGGHFFEEDGSLVVYLRDMGRTGVAQEVLSAVMIEHQRRERAPASPMKFRRADFDFLQLTRWRGQLPQAVGSIAGVQIIGTNKRVNRLEIGVVDAASRSQVIAALAEHSVPLAAVMIVEVELQTMPADDSGGDGGGSGGSGDYLTSYAARLQGGRQIWTEAQAVNGGGGACSAGLIGRGRAGTAYAGMEVMLTASHCTRTLDGVNNTWFRQPSGSDGWIGYEAWDGKEYYPGQLVDVPCAYADGCRQSDAAIIRLSGSRGLGMGEIARPKAPGGTLEVYPAYNHFRVMNVLPNRLNSGTVHQVGRTTGWSSGQIDRTCYDFAAPDGKGGRVYIICGTTGQYVSQTGDSGAPVFQRDNDAEVTAVGINFGKVSFTDGSVQGVYAPLVGISFDIWEWNRVYLFDFQWTYI